MSFTTRSFTRDSLELPVLSLPQVNLDAYRVCFFQQWRPGELIFITVAVSFGTLFHLQPLADNCSPRRSDAVPRCDIVRRSLRVPYHFHSGQGTSTEEAPWYSEPFKQNSARRDGILPAHVCLSNVAPVLLVFRPGGLIRSGL